MGNLGFFEILLIGFATLILFGPDKLPELARRLGKFSADLKKTSDSVRREFYNSLYIPAETLKGEVESVKRELRAVSEMHPLCPDTPREVKEQAGLDQSAALEAKPDPTSTPSAPQALEETKKTDESNK